MKNDIFAFILIILFAVIFHLSLNLLQQNKEKQLEKDVGYVAELTL